MKLYWFDTANPRKACAVAKYLQSPVEYVHVDLGRGEHKAPAYLALNPNGKVPTLVDGERTLWESAAIMCHLAARSDSELWPQDDRQIDVIRWLSWDLAHFYKCGGTLYFEHVIKPRFGLGDTDRAAVAQATNAWGGVAAILDSPVHDRRWLTGNGLSIADFAVAAMLPYAQPARIPLGEFSAVQRWHDRLNELDAWREPFPELAVAA
jgi:glutathione S-transferase